MTDFIFVSLDGEKFILDAILDVVHPATGEKLSTLFRVLNIDIVKSSASCSLITNPADSGEVFAVLKLRLGLYRQGGSGMAVSIYPMLVLKKSWIRCL